MVMGVIALNQTVSMRNTALILTVCTRLLLFLPGVLQLPQRLSPQLFQRPVLPERPVLSHHHHNPQLAILGIPPSAPQSPVFDSATLREG